MSDKHPTCPKCNGLLKFEPADILGPDRVKCILCGWEKHRAIELNATTPVVAISSPKTEDVMSNTTTVTKRGQCPSCKRDDVLLPGPKCSRCYDRISRGIDVITGEPVKVFRAHDHAVSSVPAAVTSSAAPTPVPAKKSVPVKAAADSCTIDIIQVLDDVWISQRSDIIRRLNTASGSCSQLAMAISFVDRIKQLGA